MRQLRDFRKEAGNPSPSRTLMSSQWPRTTFRSRMKRQWRSCPLQPVNATPETILMRDRRPWSSLLRGSDPGHAPLAPQQSTGCCSIMQQTLQRTKKNRRNRRSGE